MIAAKRSRPMPMNPSLGPAAGADASTIAHDDLVAGLEGGALALVDVREPDEFAAGHIPGAVNLPMSRFDAALLPKEKPVALVCQTGRRSGIALAQARAAGRADVRHYAPGTKGWRDGGAPLER
jgi:rhodanese-related sulfurtransferase